MRPSYHIIDSSQNANKIAWYKHSAILGVEENQLNYLSIYLNPSKGLVFINLENETIVSATIFDILGKRMYQLNQNIKQLDISTLQNGMYFLKPSIQNGEFV